jgi:cytochrome c oxidase subunit IV
MSRIALGFAGVWILLLLLLAATSATAYLDLGEKAAALHVGVAALQILLVWLFFMNLRGSDGAVRLFAILGFFWLALMFSLTFGDYSTRGWDEPYARYSEIGRIR